MNKPTQNVNCWLFDCDDTLVHSESKAFEACCGVVNLVLANQGVDIAFTPESLKARFVGTSFRKMVTDLGVEHSFTLERDELEKLVLDEQLAVTARLENEVEELEGASDLLRQLSTHTLLAVVSSSALPRVRACLKKTGQQTFFEFGRVFSAQALAIPTSKPDPAVYLYAMEQLGKTADECVAVEDSVNGIKSAVAAGIAVLGFTGALPVEERAKHAEILLSHGAFAVVEHMSDARAAVEDAIWLRS